MNGYFTIEKIYKEELTVKDSKFISFLYPINSKNEFKEILDLLWKKHPKARHICYAYIIDQNDFHYYDDGEPNGTAGLKIYSALKIKNLSRCALFVVRYFGGTKLGTGLLAKAYFDSSIKVINSANIVEKYFTKEIILNLDYHLYQRIKNIIKDFSVYEPIACFTDKIELKVFVKPENLENFIKTMKEFNLKIIFNE